MPCQCDSHTRCHNPKCRKIIPAINLEFGGSFVIINWPEALDFDTMRYACGEACRIEARKAYEEEFRERYSHL